jgi:hypothetical protein
MKAPAVQSHDSVSVIRDDLFPGGTKARFIPILFAQADEIVYASPAEGGAQTALAEVARQSGKRATIFVAKRATPHARSLMAKALGAKVIQVEPGYLSVVQARAKAYAAARGALLAPFGLDMPQAVPAIAEAARQTGLEPDEVWCAGGSGVLARGLKAAWPDAGLHVVQVGRKLDPAALGAARIYVHRLKFGDACRSRPPFPSDPHYDAKAWEILRDAPHTGHVVFWNVTGPAG